MTSWKDHAERLAKQLQDSGCVRSPSVVEAFASIPRHLFVPEFYAIDDTGNIDWNTKIDAGHPSYLEEAYRNEYLPTQCKPLEGSGELAITSSSSAPSLMADMLEELDLQPGMKVLEIGTGTGYNAAILCHILGDANVTTIDIDPELLSLARQRLRRFGYQPCYRPARHRYDRILATHSVPDIPAEWLTWCKPGGVILVDVRPAEYVPARAWAKLTAQDDGTATGRLMKPRGHFMGARKVPEMAYAGRPVTLPQTEGEARAFWGTPHRRETTLAPTWLDDPAFGFLVWRAIPGVRWLPGETTLVDSPDSRRVIVEAGEVLVTPGDLWADIERLFESWHEAGRPSLEELQVTVDTDGHIEASY